jgi:hypothetical protein
MNSIGDGKGNSTTYTEHVLEVGEWIDGPPKNLEPGMIIEFNYLLPEGVPYLVGDINDDLCPGDNDYDPDRIKRYRRTNIIKLMEEMK